VRRELVSNPVPTMPGGGTIAFVDPVGHRYLDDPVAREEGGTPAIVESVRAGLVMALKQAVGTDLIQERERRLLGRALDRWRANPNLELLGNLEVPRLPIVSFRVRHGGRYLHHELVVALLNDLFGVQARGGCSCAGPYGHRLLDIDLDHSHRFEAQIATGCEGIKPGWVRVNFNYFVDEEVFTYVVEAVRLVAREGWRLLGDYRFDPMTGLWHHRTGPVEPPLRLSDVAYASDGSMTYPRHTTTAPVSVLREHLDEGRAIMAAASPPDWSDTAHLGADFDDLRWFALPACSLG
jgi:hypothetical protein